MTCRRGCLLWRPVFLTEPSGLPLETSQIVRYEPPDLALGMCTKSMERSPEHARFEMYRALIRRDQESAYFGRDEIEHDLIRSAESTLARPGGVITSGLRARGAPVTDQTRIGESQREKAAFGSDLMEGTKCFRSNGVDNGTLLLGDRHVDPIQQQTRHGRRATNALADLPSRAIGLVIPDQPNGGLENTFPQEPCDVCWLRFQSLPHIGSSAARHGRRSFYRTSTSR